MTSPPLARLGGILVAALLVLPGLPPAKAQTRAEKPARLTLIIDDLGQNLPRDRRVLQLPGPVALSILPDTPHAGELAREAASAGHTVMLHLPMDPAGGPFAWHPGMSREERFRRLEAALSIVPQAEGLNNHMGSRMTAELRPMQELMADLQNRHLYFVDSRTSARTVAAASAQQIGLASLSRDVFLDDDPSPEAVARQFEKGVELARRQGSVVMIGHPHPATLNFLEHRLPQLQAEGIQWISVDMMIAVRGNKAMPAHGKQGVYPDHF